MSAQDLMIQAARRRQDREPWTVERIIVHALLIVFVLIAIGPVLIALRRVARRAAFEAPVDFAPPPTSKSIMH